MATAVARRDWASDSPASPMEPVIVVDEMMSSCVAPPPTTGTHITFQYSPASSVSDSMATPEVVIDLTTASERPRLVVVVEDGGATAPPPLDLVDNQLRNVGLVQQELGAGVYDR